MDWDTNRLVMKVVPVNRRHCVTKFESRMCGTGKMMKIWKQRLVDDYPRYRKPNETPTYILKFKNVTAFAVWENIMAKLEEWLDANKPFPESRRLVVQLMD